MTSKDPPKGPPWDEALDRAPLAFVDLEMTGNDAKKDRVIEICVERSRGAHEEARFASLVRPVPLVTGNVAIHGIREADLEGAPTFAEVAPKIAPLFEGAIVVGHATWHDVAFLEAEHARLGLRFEAPFWLDTLALSRRAFALTSHTLTSVAAAIGAPLLRPHRAEEDVRAMRAVFEKAASVLSATTPRDLWHVRPGERHPRPEVLAAAVHAVETGEDVLVRYRPTRRAPEDLPMRLTAIQTDLDPPRVLGYLLASRGRRELRADRVLAILPMRRDST